MFLHLAFSSKCSILMLHLDESIKLFVPFHHHPNASARLFVHMINEQYRLNHMVEAFGWEWKGTNNIQLLHMNEVFEWSVQIKKSDEETNRTLDVENFTWNFKTYSDRVFRCCSILQLSVNEHDLNMNLKKPLLL